MKILERLDGWKESGIISEPQHASLTTLVRRERFSVFVELNALLYLGVLSLVAGLGWTFRDYIDNLGDAAILSILSLLTVGAIGYCIARGRPYSRDEVESPTLLFDYVLYFGCLMFSSTLAFVETRFGVFRGWDTHLLLASLVFGGLAYRFDNRFVLSLALSTLAGFLGLQFDLFDRLGTDWIRLAAALYGAFLLGVGAVLHRQRVKQHFTEVYLQLGANAILLSAISGVFEAANWPLYLVAVLALSAASIYLGVRYRRFAFVAYGTLYGYAALTVRMMTFVGGAIGGMLYFLVTGTAVLMALVIVARKFGRDE